MTARAVLFDVDGTLVDSTYLHTVSWWQAFRRAGEDVPMAHIHRAIGMGADNLVPHVLGRDVDEDTLSSLADAHDAVYATYWPALRAFAGARELIRHCHDAGLTTVLASSAGADQVEVIRRLLDVDEWLDHSTSSADGDQSKPAPDLVQIALDKAGADAADAVFVGDAVPDVEACARAGVRCITLTCGGTGAEELRTAGAVEVYEDAAALLKAFGDSALAHD